MFRGKPAITKFDRLITPNRKSSQGFATPTGAALRRSAPSACSRLAHPASGLAQPTLADYLRLPTVRLAGWVNLLAHYAKGTLWPMRQLLQPTSGFALAAWRAAPLPSRYSTLPILELVSLGGRGPRLRPRCGLLDCRRQIRVERGQARRHHTTVDDANVSSSSRFPYHYLVSTSLRLPAARSGYGPASGLAGPLPRPTLSERDGRCVQSLISLHRDLLMHDY